MSSKLLIVIMRYGKAKLRQITANVHAEKFMPLGTPPTVYFPMPAAETMLVTSATLVVHTCVGPNGAFCDHAGLGAILLVVPVGAVNETGLFSAVGVPAMPGIGSPYHAKKAWSTVLPAFPVKKAADEAVGQLACGSTVPDGGGGVACKSALIAIGSALVTVVMPSVLPVNSKNPFNILEYNGMFYIKNPP